MRSATKEALTGAPATGGAADATRVRNTRSGPSPDTTTLPPPPRTNPSRWHIATCWRALESVADQLGDPPRLNRYLQLAADRKDLPSPATLRAQLGTWPGIAAALTEQRSGTASPDSAAHEPPRPRRARRAGAAKESIGGGRLATQVEVTALRYLNEHPGSSGTAVKNGVGIRHPSQASALLARLEREGLLVKERHGSRNAWGLSKHGESVLEGLPERMYA